MDSSLSIPASLLPGLSPTTAHVLSFLFTSTYVGSIYLSQTRFFTSPSSTPGTRTPTSTTTTTTTADGEPCIPPISASDKDAFVVENRGGPPVGSRDHPATIRRRMKAVVCATGLSIWGVFYVVKNLSSPSKGGNGWESWTSAVLPTLKLLGLPTGLSALRGDGRVLPYLIAPSLLIGPLAAMYLDGELPIVGGRNWGEGTRERVKRGWREFGLVEVRNYLVGPFTEELVFRSTILAVSILGKLSFKSLVFGTPMWFGIAHAHHALEVYRKNGSTKNAAVQAILGCLFQLTYTTLFGWFASYLFLRTGSVLPPLTAHIYCNIMGIYLPGSAIRRHPNKAAIIWGSYLAGIGVFVWGLRRL
ncbi:hypothetical protein CI109_106748 [Kwoniella shandongensis]|uniref:intramembrane prenyl-peptidase Rce1 n=1 Tax=Kwoniella shandongensis TaxID=1734106 RepID=A0A5M6CBL5_9TREE|nr:uncharacterized protein CI109_000995 [Kwoniella shandongensis]KAA5530815.1 hypothetical protein CI109_000995 [Kwoniella shandongensis]